MAGIVPLVSQATVNGPARDLRQSVSFSGLAIMAAEIPLRPRNKETP